MKKYDKFISVVIYLKNESKYFIKFLDKLYEILNDNFKTFEIICVNDASEDESEMLVREYAKAHQVSNLTLVNLGITQGREAAIESGVDVSIGDYIYEFECVDYSTMFNEKNIIIKAFERIQEGYDIISVVSERPNNNASGIFYSIFNNTTYDVNGVCQERFRLISRRAVNRIDDLNTSKIYRKVLYASSGLKQVHIDMDNNIVDVKNRKSKISKRKNELAINALIAFTNFFPKLVSFVAIIEFIAFIILSIVFTIKNVWTFASVLILLVLMVSFVFSLLIWLVIRYLDMLIKLNLKKKSYIVESVSKLIN